MTSPIFKVPKGTHLLEALKIMAEADIGSIVITEKDGEIAGLLTAKNIVKKYYEKYLQQDRSFIVDDFMNLNPVCLPPEYPLVEALYEMQTKGEDYAVICKSKIPVGIISSKDILRILFRNVTVYETHIDSINNLNGLKEIHSNLFKIAKNLVDTTKFIAEILTVLSGIHLKIIKKVYSLTAKDYREKFNVEVEKIPHCFIIMGSGGRREMFLDPDQDNGFIYPDNLSEPEKKHLEEFANYLVDNLDFVGYEKCEGNIMVTNPEMRKTLSEWKEDIGNWIDNPGKWGIRWSSIIFDFDSLYGNESLVWDLREFILEKISEKPVFLLQMLKSDANHAIPLSIFGNFVVEKKGKYKGTFNLKRTALMFIVDVTRAFALYKKLKDLNTISRLNHLERIKALSSETVENVKEAYDIVCEIILNHQIEQAEKGEELNKFINPKKLSVYTQDKLKNALKTISKYLDKGLSYFGGNPF